MNITSEHYPKMQPAEFHDKVVACVLKQYVMKFHGIVEVKRHGFLTLTCSGGRCRTSCSVTPLVKILLDLLDGRNDSYRSWVGGVAEVLAILGFGCR